MEITCANCECSIFTNGTLICLNSYLERGSHNNDIVLFKPPNKQFNCIKEIKKWLEADKMELDSNEWKSVDCQNDIRKLKRKLKNASMLKSKEISRQIKRIKIEENKLFLQQIKLKSNISFYNRALKGLLDNKWGIKGIKDKGIKENNVSEYFSPDPVQDYLTECYIIKVLKSLDEKQRIQVATHVVNDFKIKFSLKKLNAFIEDADQNIPFMGANKLYFVKQKMEFNLTKGLSFLFSKSI